MALSYRTAKPGPGKLTPMSAYFRGRQWLLLLENETALLCQSKQWKGTTMWIPQVFDNETDRLQPFSNLKKIKTHG